MSHAARAPRRLVPFAAMAVAALLLVSLWLATHPYHGIIHDSRLYTLQALARLHPDPLKRDLFLAFGSQDAFSIISAIYAPFLAAFGNATGNILLLLLCQSLWLGAVAMLARRWLGSGTLALVGAAAAIALPGSFSLFEYGEPFLTARLPAEATAIAAVAAIAGDRRLAAAALLTLAAALHPLTALPAIVLVFVHEAIRRPPLWTLAIAAPVVVAGLAVGGIAPFDRLLLRFDPEWLAIVRLRNGYCFLAGWQLGEWLQVLNIATSAALAWRFGPARSRRLLAAAITTAAIGIATTAIGADALGNVLVTSLQTWRWLWVLALVAHIGLAPGIVAALRGAATAPSLIPFGAGLALLALSRFVGGLPLASAATGITALVAGDSADSRRLPAWLTVAGAVLLALVTALTMIAVRAWWTSPLLVGEAVVHAAIGVTITVVAAAAIGWLASTPARDQVLSSLGAPLTALALMLVTGAALNWDQRGAWRRYVDTAAAPPALVALLSGNGQNYWEGDITPLWLIMRQPSHFSCDQGGGVLFSRANAVEYASRRRDFLAFGARELRGVFCEDAGGTPAPPRRDVAALAKLCRRQPGLATLMLLTPVAGARTLVWQSPADYADARATGGSVDLLKTQRFFRYDCADFRPRAAALRP